MCGSSAGPGAGQVFGRGSLAVLLERVGDAGASQLGLLHQGGQGGHLQPFRGLLNFPPGFGMMVLRRVLIANPSVHPSQHPRTAVPVMPTQDPRRGPSRAQANMITSPAIADPFPPGPCRCRAQGRLHATAGIILHVTLCQEGECSCLTYWSGTWAAAATSRPTSATHRARGGGPRNSRRPSLRPRSPGAGACRSHLNRGRGRASWWAQLQQAP
jgi:hypothetical protein